MTRKRMAHALIALLLPLSLVSLGCGGSNAPAAPPQPQPALSSEAGLAGLSVSLGELSPPFSAGLGGSYSVGPVGYLGEASVGITATLKDAKAALTIDGFPAASGQPTSVALREGLNPIRVAVAAEDGRSSNLVTVNVERLGVRPNTKVRVLNGVMGVPASNVLLRLADAGGRVLLDRVPLPREKNGSAFLALEPGRKYNIYAKGDFSAEACFANFDRAMEDTADLYCLRNSTTYYPLQAPVIEEISFGAANSDAGGTGGWRLMPNGERYVGPAAGVAAVRVQVRTKNLIARSTWPSSEPNGEGYIVGDPLRVNVDALASANVLPAPGVVGTLTTAENIPVTVGGEQWYRNTYRAAVPYLSANLSDKRHYLDIVTYDCMGNRTEQRVYLTITDSINSVMTDPDLSGVVPTWNLMQAQTMMGGGDFAAIPGGGAWADAMDPVDGLTGYQQVIMQFHVRANGTSTNLGVRGFEVWRSMGGANDYVKVGTVNYATLTTADPFWFYDRTPSLEAGNARYRVRAFSGSPVNAASNGYSSFSDDFRLTVTPPTIVRPAAAHKAVSDKLWPQFRIGASNPLMLKRDTTDQFFFTLFVKYVDNPWPFLLIPMRVRFTECDGLTGVNNNTPLPSDDLANLHRYGFQPGKPTVQYMQVTSYTGGNNSTADGAWNYAFDSREVEGEDGSPTTEYIPFAYLDDDGSIVINTSSPKFQTAMDNQVRAMYSRTGEPFAPGATYHWNVFGNNGGILWLEPNFPANWSSITDTNAAYFFKGFNAAPYGSTFLSISYASHQNYGLGSPEGWFPLTIAPNAD